VRYAWIGDGNNMAHSWIEAAAILDLDLVRACPAGYRPDEKLLAWAARPARAGIEISTIRAGPRGGADVISTDVMGLDGRRGRAEARAPGVRRLLRRRGRSLRGLAARHRAPLLPAHRGEEITDEVIEGFALARVDAGENRLHVQ